MGILAKDGVVMASERKITSGLLAPARVRYISFIFIYYRMILYELIFLLAHVWLYLFHMLRHKHFSFP